MEKTIKEYETLIQQTSTENETLTTENTNLQHTVKTLVDENKELKEKTTAPGSTIFRLFSIGLVAGILLTLLICFAICKLN
jgi:cell division protein FtsB